MCVDCDSKKSNFLKQVKNETCIFIVKNVKNTQVTRFQKKILMISKNKIKGKSKCAICLTERTFIDKIEDEYDLESELEVYL